MKTIAICFVGLCTLVLILVLINPVSSDLPDIAEVTIQRSDKQQESSQPTPPEEPAFEETPALDLGAVSQQMEFILTDAHVGSENYLLLLKLLSSNEAEVLAYLAQLRYPENMAIEGSEYAEVEMICRALLEFYGQKPLVDNLQKVEQLRETEPLFSNIISDLFLAGNGSESAHAAYDWVMQNPYHPASLRSGATIGAIMNTFTPAEAWNKATELPTGPIRERAFTAIIAESTDGDLYAALDLINSVEATTDLDPAISNILSMAINEGHPYADLVNIAAAPVDPVYRSSSLVILFQNWALNSPESLHEWSKQTHAFPSEQMAEINLVVKQTLQRHEVQIR
ncbi:MAG: hypothetical protein ACSHYA_08245 [Opitutaceae bacterium]